MMMPIEEYIKIFLSTKNMEEPGGRHKPGKPRKKS
jgi:hypothetical protein